jgi:predicted ATPase
MASRPGAARAPANPRCSCTRGSPLFAERAHAVNTSFRIDPSTLPTVAEICRRLDGIPSATELAAARVAHISVKQIAQRLEDRFVLLAGGRRRIPRQQTLLAVLDRSHELLTDSERTGLRRLAVFAGGFTLDAAEAVAGGDDVPRRDVLNLLGSLTAKSLVIAGQDGKRLDSLYYPGIRPSDWLKVNRPGAVPPERFRNAR